MTSNEYPPPPNDGEHPASERPASPAPIEPQHGESAGSTPAPTTPYQPYGSYGAPYFQPQRDETTQPGHPTSPYDGAPTYGNPESRQAFPSGAAYRAPIGYGDQSGYGDRSGYAAAPGMTAGYPPEVSFPNSQAASLGADYPAPPPDGAGNRGRSGPRRGLLITALVAALVGGGIGGGVVALADHHNSNSVNTGLKITNTTGAPAAQLNGTVGAAAAKIRPSVVTLDVSGAQESGTGSGVIIRQDGYILTNDHVVSISGGSGEIQVLLSDGRNAPAKVVGRDNSDDLAVVKVDGLNNLTAATFAKSSSISVGQAVVAVGAPLGLSDTVTSGIVSNLARPVRAGDSDQAVFEAVQTDAAINPGNSGGPLVDLNGSVVGINAAIASDNSGGGGLQIPGQPAQQSGNIGIGFAIPADEASRIASELIANGKATHAVLGVEVGGATSNGSTASSTAGVPLHSVNAGGVAAQAGLKAGDVVTSIDGQRVTTSDSLIAAVRNHAPGQQVKITYTRNGTAASTTVTLGSSSS